MGQTEGYGVDAIYDLPEIMDIHHVEAVCF